MLTAETGATLSGARTMKARRFRRAVTLGVAMAGAVLLAATGFAFLNTNGSGTTSITAGGLSSNKNQFADVAVGGTGLESAFWALSGTASAGAASWSPVVNQVVTVGTAGDLAMIDAGGTTGNILVTLSVTNPASLSSDYSYMNVPIAVVSCVNTATACQTKTNWGASIKGDGTTGGTDANGAVLPTAASPTYLTLTNGSVSFLLKGGTSYLYEIEIPTGGSFYTVSTTSSTTASLSPSYMVTMTAA